MYFIKANCVVFIHNWSNDGLMLDVTYHMNIVEFVYVECMFVFFCSFTDT